MSEDHIASLERSPNDFLLLDSYRSQVSVNHVEASIDQDSYLAVTQLTYGAHTSSAAYKKSHKFITKDMKQHCFLFRVNGVMRYVMLPKLKLLLIMLLLMLCPLPEANNFFIYHVILNLSM